MDRARRELLLQGLMVNAKILGLVVLRDDVLGPVVLVDGIDRHEVSIQQIDYFDAGERTRSHGGSTASTPSEIHAPIHREQEHGPAVFSGQSAGSLNV